MKARKIPKPSGRRKVMLPREVMLFKLWKFSFENHFLKTLSSISMIARGLCDCVSLWEFRVRPSVKDKSPGGQESCV